MERRLLRHRLPAVFLAHQIFGMDDATLKGLFAEKSGIALDATGVTIVAPGGIRFAKSWISSEMI